ncbi:MAG: adenosine deaminase [Actinomycetia bacterium]|nr:adenosine deaminase [Actinomycetes bacterium]MCP4957982.1 adenosine deaminase [Actinomycetes bacterium]
MALDVETIRSLPKVVLHDHLDGGVRPQTIIDLASENDYTRLPTTDPDELAAWVQRGANRLDLVLYLETFAHTVGVMQTKDSLERIAYEAGVDLAADGVVYAEVRFAPELHTERGLSLDEVVESVHAGFDRASAETGIVLGVLCTAMRHQARSLEIAELAVRHRDKGVVGFDIAGAEAGNPPTRHLDAFHFVQRHNFHFTIHAGEAYGPPSIWEAVQYCGAERLGHGVRIVDNINFDDDGEVQLGGLAAYIRDCRIPLEVCPTSNVHTGAVASVEAHPIDLLKRLKFRVTVNTDNRLMSNVTMTSEMKVLVDTFGYDLTDIQWLTINGMKSSFWPFDDRLRIINEVIKPAYAEALAG